MDLFAASKGTRCSGYFRCIFCGSPASQSYSLKDSFTARDTLRCPGSSHACAGCLLALEESGTAIYHDGSRQEFTKAFRRMCSWIVTASSCVAATKAHMSYLRDVCLEPPPPPYFISIAVSGQRQILYRSILCRLDSHAVITLEGERIDYRPADLADRLRLCGMLAAATGKPALSEPPGHSLWFRVCERYSQGESLCSEWERVRHEPLSQLAAFLCAPKEACEHEYPGDRHG